MPPKKPICKDPVVCAYLEDEMVMNLRSFCSISEWNEEELDEAAMLNDFLADIDPNEREKDVQWIAPHAGPLRRYSAW